MGRSIRSRMLLAAILVEATMLTLLVVNSLRLLSGQMTEQAARHASQMTPVLHAALIAPLAQRDTATVQAILDECVRTQGIDYLAVHDAVGRTVATSGWPKDKPLPPPDHGFKLFVANGTPRYNVISQITVAKQTLGDVHFGLDLSQILAAHRQLLSQGVAIALGELLLSAGLLTVLSFWLTRHLTALTAASESVAEGNLTPPTVWEGEDDIGRLGTAFNAMSRAVRDRIHELTDARDVQASLVADIADAHTRLEEITNTMGDGLYVVDDAARITFANPRVEEILGWSNQELLGQSAHRLFHRIDLAGNASPDDDQAVAELLMGSGVYRSSDEIFARKDGELLHVSLVSTPIIRDGKRTGAVVSFQDVTELRRSAQALKESEERFAAAIDGSGDGLWDWNIPAGTVFYSSNWKAMLGYSSDEIGSALSEWESRLHPEDRQRTFHALQQHLDGALPRYLSEHRIRTRQGNYIWVLDRGSVVERDSAGRPTRMIGTHANITLRKSMERALEQRDRLLEAVSRAVAGLLNSETWEGGIPEFLLTLGIASEASRVSIFRRRDEAEGEDEVNLGLAFEWCAEGVPPKKGHPAMQDLPLRASGYPRWIEELQVDRVIHGQVAAFPESERALLVSHGIQSILVVPVRVRGVWWGFIGFDECRGGRTWSTSEQGVLRIAARALGAKVERSETRVELEQLVIERTRELDQKNLDLIAEMDARQEIEASNRDVLIELEQSRKMESIGRLAAGIAHEINTPIQFLGNNLEFIKRSYHQIHRLLDAHESVLTDLPEEKAQALGAMASEMNLNYLREEVPQAISESLEGIQRVTKIVRAMKEFSHPGGTEKVPVDVNECLVTTSTVARNEWKHLADLVLDLDPALPFIQGLPAELNQVFLNLIVNAADAIGEKPPADSGKGVITLSTRRQAQGVEIRIADNGVGIDEQVQKKIFDPFFTTKRVGKGTGQGLTVCYQVVVNRHGGTIHCQSVAGAGTTFILRLPLGAPQATAADPWE